MNETTKEIILKFDINTGETHIEAQGFTGNSCKQATEFLEKTLGKTKSFQRKSEWYSQNLKHTGRVHSNLCG